MQLLLKLRGLCFPFREGTKSRNKAGTRAYFLRKFTVAGQRRTFTGFPFKHHASGRMAHLNGR